MKLVSSEYLGVESPKCQKCQKLSMQALSSFLMLGDGSGVSDAEEEEEEEAEEALCAHENILCTLQTP